MNEFPETRESLILQVKNPSNRIAWEEFAQIYRPIIYRLARLRGMQEADAQDLAQQVLMSVSSAIGRWEKNEQGSRFRNWLARITKNAILKALSRGPRDHAIDFPELLGLVEDQQTYSLETAELIEREYRRELYMRAAAVVRTDVNPETWQAFEMTTLDGKSVDETAAKLQKSAGTIYAARSRVMRRLCEAVRELESAEAEQ